jgi:hypothetical protein
MIFNFMADNIIGRASYLPDSPDLAFCNFYLFGYVKQSLIGKEFADQEERFEVVNCIVEGIEKVILEQVFLAWMECFA